VRAEGSERDGEEAGERPHEQERLVHRSIVVTGGR
jgi:hypothetical protein